MYLYLHVIYVTTVMFVAIYIKYRSTTGCLKNVFIKQISMLMTLATPAHG